MPIIGSYSPGGPGSSASAYRYSTIDELLNQLPDNTANLIDAADIRDSVYSLWSYIGDIQTIASQSIAQVTTYTNPAQTIVSVGGISSGSSFAGTFSMQQMFDLLLYPYVAPSPSLGTISDRQYGAGLAHALSWSVTKNSNTITSIVVDGNPIVPTGNSQTGFQTVYGTHSATPPLSQTNTFTMTVSDGTTSPSTTTTLTWKNRRYWGRINLSSIGNPDLTLNPGSASLVSSFINMNGSIPNQITSLSGAGVGTGNELATTIGKTYTNIDGSGQYLIFAFPTAFGTPYFTVNGNPNTAFTKVKSNVAFRNENNFTGTNYDVWISNTIQNSPLTIVIS